MPRAWRIVKEAHAAIAFDGEGARLFGGRWNSRGVRMVYASATLSLAALEALVHLNPPVTLRYVALPINFDESLLDILPAARLPADWASEPPRSSTQALGDQWVKQARSVVLQVPSAIIPSEPNFLLNPTHPSFRKIRIGKPRPFSFSFDRRLL